MAAETAVFDAWFREIDTNFIYTNIINNKIVKPPHQNISFRKVFTQDRQEIWDKKNFFVQKRDWLTKLPLYSLDWLWEYVEDKWEWIFTDYVDIQWSVYFFAKLRDETKMRIYKLCNVSYDEFWDYDRCSWTYLNVSNYKYTNTDWSIASDNSYPFAPWISDKFVKTMNFVWQKSCDTYNFEIRYSVLGDPNSIEFVVSKNWQPISANEWDFIMVTDWNSVLGWYAFEVAYTTTDNKTWLYSYAPQWWNPVPQYHTVGACLFSWYWNSFSWITADWVLNRSWDECSPSTFNAYYSPWTYFNTINWQNINGPRKITGLAVYENSLFYYDKKNWYVVPSIPWYNKNVFRTIQAAQTGTQYTSINVFQDFLLLLWPNDIWYITSSYNNTLAVWQNKFVELSNHNWYYNEWSWINVDDNFYLVRDSEELYWLWLQNTGVWVKPIFTLLSTFLNTDLKKLNRSTWDRIFLDVRWNDIDIYLTQNEWNCQIMRYNAFYKVWHKWIILWWIELRKSYKWLYLGNWLYCNNWDTDNWDEIIQIINMTFWDQTECVEKNIWSIKLRIWYNSVIDDNTVLNIEQNSWWREYPLSYPIHNTEYISAIMQAKDANRYTPIKEYSSWVCIWTWVWIGNDKVYHSLSREINEYKNYKFTAVNPHWDDEDAQSLISKYTPIEIPLSLVAEIITVELVAYAKNSIEFGWFFFIYGYTDSNVTRFENTIESWSNSTDSALNTNRLNLYPKSN